MISVCPYNPNVVAIVHRSLVERRSHISPTENLGVAPPGHIVDRYCTLRLQLTAASWWLCTVASPEFCSLGF